MSERRHSTRNRGEPPMKLRKSPDPTAASAVSPPSTGPRKVGRPRRSETAAKDTPTKALKASVRAKAKDSPKPATPVPEVQEVREVIEDMKTLMEKSRQRWLNDGGVFERYWTQPPRKKKNEPASTLPTKQAANMVEIGSARLVIDPHVFDVQVWGVKKPALSWQPPIEAAPANTPPTVAPAGPSTPVVAPQPPRPVPQNPYVRPPPGTTPQATPIQPANPRGLAPNPYAMPTATQQGKPSTAQVTPKIQQSSPPPPKSGPVATPGHAPHPTPTPHAPAARAPPPAPAPAPVVQQPGQPHPDPVIQMLAQRAAGDPALKDLMKEVAGGAEAPAKLAEFQRHINEITEIVKQQQAKGIKFGVPQQQTPVQPKPQPKTQARATPIQSKPPVSVNVEYSHLTFDFIRKGDCYEVPKSSIIQHLPDGATTLISFLFTCKGKDVPNTYGGSRLQPEVTYYQPITISMLTVERAIRTALTQVVDKPDQVKKDMEEIMEKYTLAPDAAVMIAAASVATRGAKRDIDGNRKMSDIKPVEVAPEEPIEEVDDELRMEWGAPDSLLPL